MDRVKLWQNICAKVLGVVGRITFAGLTLLLLAALANSDARAAEVSFADFPFLIACEAGGTQHAYYLSRIGRDGAAVYMTPARQAGMSSCVLWAVHSRPPFRAALATPRLVDNLAERARKLAKMRSPFLLCLAAKFLVRQTRPVFRLSHPEDPVCWLTLCELSA